MTTWRMLIACWITKAENTHSKYVILKDFALQQLLHKHAPMLCFMYIACLVYYYIVHDPVSFTHIYCCKQVISMQHAIWNTTYSFRSPDRATLVPRALKGN